MAAVVFPKKDNPYWPLPADYMQLDSGGQRQARVNVMCLPTERPDLAVARWAFFREHYLFHTPQGMFYKHGVVKSPLAHYEWVHTWNSKLHTITAAPRSAAKSTIVKENILADLVSKPYYENLIFLAKDDFAKTAIADLMAQIEHNERIIEDFGRLKPGKAEGIWNMRQLKLRNGAMVTGLSITGASLGKRPHCIWFDDVEKDESLIINPSELVRAFQKMLFNVVYPMAENTVPIRIIGTLLSRRTFIYWLETTDDPRIKGRWGRIWLGIRRKHPVTGEEINFWDEKMGDEFQADRKAALGPTAYAAQYENNPLTDEARTLHIDDELNTYHLLEQDDAAYLDPLHSNAKMVMHTKVGDDESTQTSINERVVRPWSEALANMTRVITVDYAPTTDQMSDYSAIHVLGWETTGRHVDTLYSLDLKVARWSSDELITRIYQMAIRWGVRIVGVEAYDLPLHTQFYERVRDELPSRFEKKGIFTPTIMRLKFPTSIPKSEKIKGLEWRFRTYKIKLPLHLKDRVDEQNVKPYGTNEPGLWYQIENFTADMALLRYDDAIDTLAMHTLIGKSRSGKEPEVRARTPIEHLKDGEFIDSQTGISYFGALNASELSDEALDAILEKKRRYHAELSPDSVEKLDWRKWL